jgi:hypothetical protein
MSAKALLGASVSAAPVYVEDVFSTYLYTGNGSTQTITNGIDLAGEGGLVWIKSRSLGTSHVLTDTARGSSSQLYSDRTNAQGTVSDQVTAFTGSGFSLGTDALGTGTVNANAATYASWTFRKAEKFFDVVTYTGNGSTQNIAHNLGSVPGCIIVKQTNGTNLWTIYHRGVDASNPQNYGLWFQTNARDLDTYWNNTAPTATQFTVGPKDGTNASGGTYVAYLFAHDAGGFGDAGTDSVVSCGSFTYNSTSGNVVDLGWEPQFVLFKSASSSGNWYIQDTMRGMVAGPTAGARLFPNLSNAEDTGFVVGPYATGFNVKSGFFTNSDTIIYIAIRRGPMKTPTVGTEVLESVAYTGDGSSNRTIGSSLTPDFVLWMDRDATSTDWSSHAQGIWDRIRGEDALLSTSNANQESPGWANLYFNLDQQVGWSNGTNSVYTNNSGTDYVTHHLRRAPGFFDVVAYTGTGASIAVNHNLGVTPELIIGKCRTYAFNWIVYHQFLGTGAYISLNTDAARTLSSLVSAVSATSFTGEANAMSYSGNTHVAYLFATAPGVSKVGSYTGTGTTLNIDCGFTAGARFVMIKRTDSTGDWYVWDTARGIISGDDPYLLLNSTAAEVTNTDYIDPLSSGFQISSTAPAAINANGGSFIFLAIA